MNEILKAIISAGIIVAANKFAKTNPTLGAFIISLPIMSILTVFWMNYDQQGVEKISQFSISTFWFVIPSLSFFLFLPLFLSFGWNFYISILAACAGMLVCYQIAAKIFSLFGIQI